MSLGKLGFFLSVILISAVVTSLIINIHLYTVNTQLNDELILAILGISKQSSVVQECLILHPKAQWRIEKLYVGSGGSVYTVGNNWELQTYIGTAPAPRDGKSHYCWRVSLYELPRSRFHEPKIIHVINVFIDKDTWEIVMVE
jgi:hypothetical protein